MELGYERRFREWAAARGHGWERLRLPRPEAGGESRGYRITPAGGARGVALAVHGAGNDALFALVGVFKRLLASGLEVVTFDLDGHGREGATRFAPATVASAVPAIAEASGAARRGLPLHAIGVSLGGAILLAALPALGARSAVLMCAPLRIHLSWGAIGRELGPGLARTLWRERGDYGLTGLIPSFGPFKRDVYPLRLGVEPGRGPFGYVDALNATLGSLSLEDAARRTTSPVLLVYGARDRLVPAEQGESLARLIPRSELLTLPRETHLTAPLSPAAVARVLEWVA